MAVARVAWISASLAERNVVDSLPRTAWSRAPIRSPSPRHREHPRRTPVIGDWLPGPANGSGTQRYIHVLSPGAWALPGDTWQTFVFLWSRLRPFLHSAMFPLKEIEMFRILVQNLVWLEVACWSSWKRKETKRNGLKKDIVDASAAWNIYESAWQQQMFLTTDNFSDKLPQTRQLKVLFESIESKILLYGVKIRSNDDHNGMFVSQYQFCSVDFGSW